MNVTSLWQMSAIRMRHVTVTRLGKELFHVGCGEVFVAAVAQQRRELALYTNDNRGL